MFLLVTKHYLTFFTCFVWYDIGNQIWRGVIICVMNNRNNDLGMMSTAASLGLLLLWDVDGGLTQIDKYLYSNEDFIKVRKVFRLSV